MDADWCWWDADWCLRSDVLANQSVHVWVQAIDAVLFPKDSWITKQGFDSGLIVLNRGKVGVCCGRVL